MTEGHATIYQQENYGGGATASHTTSHSDGAAENTVNGRRKPLATSHVKTRRVRKIFLKKFFGC